MKTIIFGFAILGASLTSCGNNKPGDYAERISTSDSSQTNTQKAHTPAAASFEEVIRRYLDLKNALANDNGKEAATHGKALLDALNQIDTASLSAEQKEMFADAGDDAKMHSEHIGENAEKIAHQREHFDMLSNEMLDLVKAFGSSQTLYKSHCPMYNNKKGADWLSETKEISNPYFGKRMLSCGIVKEEIKPKS